MPDLPALRQANEAMLANPDVRLRLALRRRGVAVSRTFVDRSPWLRSARKLLRVHQWAKNALLLLPLLLAHSFRARSIVNAGAAFLCFCAIASSTYILNDLLDLESDRIHVRKRKRPFAAGDIPVSIGLAVSGLLAVLSFTIAAWLPARFLFFLFLYLITTVAYSFRLKRTVLVDVIVLSGLYTVRVVAGGAATHTVISPWLAGFSIFLFLSLAMVKRFSELKNLLERGAQPSGARGYLLSDIEQLRSSGTAAGYASVVVFSLYINGNDVAALYHHPSRLWLLAPFLILWINRVWLLASRGELHEDPVVFALTDRMSLLLGLAVMLIVWLAV